LSTSSSPRRATRYTTVRMTASTPTKNQVARNNRHDIRPTSGAARSAPSTTTGAGRAVRGRVGLVPRLPESLLSPRWHATTETDRARKILSAFCLALVGCEPNPNSPTGPTKPAGPTPPTGPPVLSWLANQSRVHPRLPEHDTLTSLGCGIVGIQEGDVPRFHRITRTMRRILYAAINRSPKENMKLLGAKMRYWYSPGSIQASPKEFNAVVPDVNKEPVLAELAVSRLPQPRQAVGLLGNASDTSPFAVSLTKAGVKPVQMEWDWGHKVDLPERIDTLLVCKVPMNSRHWQALKKLREETPAGAICVHELLLPFSPIQLAQSLLPYYKETSTLSSIAPYYLGREYFGPIDRLDHVLPLSGKSVIEFGPMDGCHTAGLVAAGVRKLVSIDARPENYIKTLIARQAFGWDNVELIMDDFHNVDRTTYGSFDLVFAHGVYYHSTAPFHFFQNMLSLSSNIFIGGFCATDSLPAGPYEVMTHGGREYRAKQHEEARRSMMGGINATGYFFHKDDLMMFFRDEGCEVTVLSDEQSDVIAGRYLRFLARRAAS
jgi:hypothetical protein